ncbi:TonB-dependent receptor [Pedobacter sp. MC2016-14]|uniref:SusC/RagA family TonB-linked outer membrane protein n=1 Tax=Pedobacter sp. MC2016-14 TaxID=2897327 RepID=UPI001E4A3F7C|nr:TonB-dependent receptor [Pedobacter sp. MC2016-14]MCD0488678.1 TonB-dependent receptor [Pedobacter sp. MC2016-14]
MKRTLLLFSLFLTFFGAAQAQTRQVTGKVTDKSNNETIPGVSITVKGTNVVVSTDTKGEFKIAVPTTGTVVLVARYVGYKPSEITVGTQTKINFSLAEDVNTLNEVVVNIGYGTVKKKDLTGAVSSVTADVIAAAPVSSALQAIQGRVAGVNISSTEGSPDAEMTIRVRGGGSLTGDNTPLYILDGFPVASISDIAPADIESIDILKDASSTAIYGSRGANGVILVTTKNSKNGKTAISFSSFTGIRKLAKKLDVLTPLDYATFQYERSLLANAPNEYTKYFGNYQDIDLYGNVVPNDWQEIVFGRTGTTYNQNLNISGGGEKTKFSLSHSYVKDKAIMIGSGYQRHNMNFKLNHKLYDKLTLDFGVRYSDTKTEGGGANEQNEKSSADSRLKYAMIYPAFPVGDLTDNDVTDPNFNLYNPIDAIYDNDQLIRRKMTNLSGALTYNIVDGLRLRSEIGYDGYKNEQDRYYGSTTYFVINNVALYPGLPAVIFTNTTRNAIRNTNTLSYDFKKLLGKDHNLNFLLGHEYIKTAQEIHTTQIDGFPATYDFDATRKLSGQGKESKSAKVFSPDDVLLSFFSRANYDYKGKYLLSATFRADGSSKFLGSKNRWGYFPSASGAWRISAEEFMDDTKSWLNDLKLRLSYGTAGNNNIPVGQTIQLFAPNDPSTPVYTNGYANFLAPNKTQANPDLKWETTITRNIGLDFSLFNSKVTGTIDLYKNKTKDLLLLYLTGGGGYDNQYRNIGATENKGLEFSANWNAVRKTNFDLSLNANISFNKNKVQSLGGLSNYPGTSGWASTEIGEDYRVEEGASVGRIFGYQSDGRYNVSDFLPYNGSAWQRKPGVVNATDMIGTLRPGSMKLKDLNGDGVINLSDRTIIGNATPSHTGGFSINTRIYNFDIGTYFNWSYGNDIYNANKIEYTSTSKYNSRNMISVMETGSRWTNLRANGTISNDGAELEAMNANTTLWSPYMSKYVLTDWAVEDGSFLRLGTLTLGYTLGKDLSKKLGMKSLRVYTSAYNLFVITNYSGFDPEVSTRRKDPLTPGVDYSAYPKSKTYVVGLNVNF